MLAQLLRKHGLGARVAAYRAASREAIASLDVSGIKMICISCLDTSGSLSHLRFLLRRLKTRLPHVPIMVGPWPEGDKPLGDEAVSTNLGADYYATSLREAVNACREAAIRVEPKHPLRRSKPSRDTPR